MKKMKIENASHVLYGLLFTQAISLVGSRMTSVALGIWLYQKTGKTMDLLLIPLFNELPSLIFGHIIGTVVDRSRRKWTIALADMMQAIGSLFLYMSIMGTWYSNSVLYGVVFLQGIFSAAQHPAADGAITMLTNANNRARINSIKELIFPATGVLAPVFAGLLYVRFNIEGVILADMVTFLIAMAIFVRLPVPELVRDSSKEDGDKRQAGFYAEMRAGFEFLKAHHQIMLLVLVMGMVNFLLNGPLEMVIPYVLERSGSTLALSLMLSIMSVSTSFSALALSVLNVRRKRVRFISASVAVSGAAMILFGIMRSVGGLSLMLFILMLPLPALNVMFKSILQEKTPEIYQGRVFAVSYQWAYGIAPLSFLLYGWIADSVVMPYFERDVHPVLVYLFGNGKGAALGLVMTLSGILMVVLAMFMTKVRSLGSMEEDLPTQVE